MPLPAPPLPPEWQLPPLLRRVFNPDGGEGLPTTPPLGQPTPNPDDPYGLGAIMAPGADALYTDNQGRQWRNGIYNDPNGLTWHDNVERRSDSYRIAPLPLSPGGTERGASFRDLMQPAGGGGGGTALEQAIDAASSDPRVRQAMRMAAMLEGGNLDGGWGVGDQGQSFGPYQIHLPAHPGMNAQTATDPTAATRYMVGAFSKAVTRVPTDLWQTDPMRASALAAYYSEKPYEMYSEDRIRDRWNVLQQRQQRPAMQQMSASYDAQALDTARAAAGGNLTPNQFQSGLAASDAASACGPAAAVAFARFHGRNPTLQEAVNMAREVGWSPNAGMAGPASQVALLNKMGIQSHLEQGVDWNRVAYAVQTGTPVILDSPSHYYVAEGYDPATGKFDFGNSALVLRASGGRRWLSPQELNQLGAGYQIRTTIWMDQ
jgi:hypothetical protein